ncbi:hypothetical protein D1J36_008005 [Riemerella anatipestifer]|uniref:hypothetical protein n=1 Tax=Riemerella anatipestifer TaxID=34085 RepID=UPI0012ADCB7D|nr:hypothetical protein [Riemerella anatipestifer]USL95214.1 hypothetical protein D1J36_008005 [Riemerella anatipestifer]
MPNANGDLLYNKSLVIKDNGWIGYEDKPKIKRYVLRNDVVANNTEVKEATDLFFPVQANKLYKVKICVKFGNKNVVSPFLGFYSTDLSQRYDSFIVNMRQFSIFNTPDNYSLNPPTVNAQSFVYEFLLETNVDTIIKNNLKVQNNNSTDYFITLGRGTFIEVEEITI